VSVTNVGSTATCAPIAHHSEPPVNPPDNQAQEPPSRNWEFSENVDLHQAPSGVKGKLKQCLTFWKNELKANKFVVNVIDEGYKIPFICVPPPFYAKNNKSSIDHPEFVETAIAELLENRCVIQVQNRPYCCNPLTVAAGKKLRLVLDLRHPNQFVSLSKFKFEDLTHIAQVLDFNQYYFSFDFKSGYHHVDIFQPHQQYLGFCWSHDSSTRYYVFTVLPFGLNSACYLFTKLTRPLVYYWRARGINSFIYIDDGLIVSPTMKVAHSNLSIVRYTIARCGFVPSESKCVWQPSTRIQYLGFIIDSLRTSFFVPQSKISKLLATIDGIYSVVNSANSVPVKDLACFAGQVISMTIALGPISKLMTRASYRAIESRVFWSDRIFLPDPVLKELRFWSSNIPRLNGAPFIFRLAPSIQVFSDASDTGIGGYIRGIPELRFHATWTPTEKQRSSTWRELAAVLRTLSEFRNHLSHHKVKWFTDNSNVPRIITGGSVKADLHEIALDIFNVCRSHDIVIIPEWLPRSENKLADKISKFKDYDDWSIDNQSFTLIEQLWGPHTVDRFASPHNNKLSVFNARFWCRGVSGLDAFCQDWSHDNNYFCPPISLIVQVVKRMAASKAIGTLVVPRWQSSHFWPHICPDGTHLHGHVRDWRLMNTSFSPSSLGEGSVFCANPSFLTLALRFDFKSSPRYTNRGFCCSEPGYCQSCA
jgi:hypothetical protein